MNKRTGPRFFWMDVPAILGLALVLVFLIALSLWNPERVRRDYEVTAQAALDAGDAETALVAGQRLLSLGGESRNVAILVLAKAKLEMGRTADAWSLLSTVAPLDRPVFAPAHLFVAGRLLNSNPGKKRNFEIGRQIENALTLEPLSVEAWELLSRFHMQNHNWTGAKEALLKIVDENPPSMFPLIEVCHSLSDVEGANVWTDKALAYFRNQFESSNAPHEAHRIYYCEALIHSRNFEKAISILEAGEDPPSRLGAVVYRAWAEDLAKNDPGNLDARIQVLRAGRAQFPDDAVLRDLEQKMNR